MTETDFKNRFCDYWQQKYPLDMDHNFKERVDRYQLERSLKTLLYNYAQEVQKCGISRIKSNKAQRIFDELGVDPGTVEFEKRW